MSEALTFRWPTSVWSTVPRLCLIEKGYSDEEYSIKNVDISELHTHFRCLYACGIAS